jgi:hypothetical protein
MLYSKCKLSMLLSCHPQQALSGSGCKFVLLDVGAGCGVVPFGGSWRFPVLQTG